MTLDSFNAFTIKVMPQSALWKYSMSNFRCITSKHCFENVNSKSADQTVLSNSLKSTIDVCELFSDCHDGFDGDTEL